MTLPENNDFDEFTTTEHWLRFPICSDTDKTQAFFDVCINEDINNFVLSETDASRLICHVIIQHLPDAGLAEVLHGMTDALEFHVRLPRQEAIEHSVRMSKSHLVGTVTAPVFSAEEE